MSASASGAQKIRERLILCQRLIRKEKRQKKENVPISFKFMIFFLFWNFDFNLNKKVFD